MTILLSQMQRLLYFEEKDGIPIVSNRKEISYEATRMGASLQPHTYYGEFISLDKASAKGGGKAEYKSITPENVFFDDSKVCFSISTLTGKGKNRSIVQAHFSRPALFYAGLPGRRLLHQRKQLTFIIPQSLSRFHLTEKTSVRPFTVNAASTAQATRYSPIS